MSGALPAMWSVRSTLLAAGLLLAAGAWFPATAGEDTVATLQTQLEVEELLWASSIQRLGDLRRKEERQRARTAELTARLDRQLAERSAGTQPGQLEDIEDAITVARRTAEALAEQAAHTRQSLLEHWRRIAALETALEEARSAPDSTDALSGTWRIVMVPSGSQGVFQLKLDGTLVGGSYLLDGGFHGSLRGTFVGRAVKLERIDSERGFDIIYEGRLAPGNQRIDGAWRATLLTSGGPAGGTWYAQRQRSAE